MPSVFLMTPIGLILIAKIVVTGALVAGPFLLLPGEKLGSMLRTTGEGSHTVFRLYGVAVLALLVGYASGFWPVAEGRFPWGVVAMGFVSNAGAAAILLATGRWSRARLLTVFVTGIAIALAAAAANSRAALVPLW